MELLIEAIDTLGDIKAQIKRLEEQEKKLADTVKEQLKENNRTSFATKKYSADMVTPETRKVDVKAYRAAVSDEEFMASISVTLKEMDKHTTEAMQKTFVKKVDGTPKLTVKEIK